MRQTFFFKGTENKTREIKGENKQRMKMIVMKTKRLYSSVLKIDTNVF